MIKKVLSGKEVSLADFSKSGVIDYKFELQSVPGFNWIKRDFDLADNKHEIVVARDVICHSIFNVFSVAAEMHLKNVSYPAVLNTFKIEHSRSGDALSVTVPGYVKKIAGPVFIIGGHNNHYHWLLNWFPRVMHLKRFDLMSRFPDLKFLVCSGLPSVYYDMFDSVGIPREKLIMHGMRDAVHIECAVFSNFFSSHNYYRDVFNFYRQGEFYSSARDVNRARGAIFITRQNLSSSRRKIANSEELSRVLISHGVRSVELDGVSVANQADIFANSSTIVAGHGAGLANLVFAKPGTKLIIFENKINSEFVSLAYWLGLEVYAIPTAQVEYDSGVAGEVCEPRLRDFYVDCEFFSTLLAKVENASPWYVKL